MTRVSKYAAKRAAAAHICRLILGIVFIFSGFVKSVDPWGTAIKVNEYLSIYGLERLNPAAMIFSIWLCGAELMMGLMLTFKVRIRLISIFAFASMSFFTVLTFLSATWLPVEDCGCFGEAVKLSPWATFAKNAVLLPMSFVLWLYYRPEKILAFSRREVMLTVLFFTIGMGVGTYCYRHLPLIDYLPFKVGVNLRDEVLHFDESQAECEVSVVCRNRSTQEIREFALADAEWQNENEWEWLDTRTSNDDGQIVVAPMISEFVLRDADGDATEEVLKTPGRLYMLCVTNLWSLDSRCEQRMAHIVEQARGENAAVICLTPDYLQDITYRSFGEGAPVRCYNVDATLMKTMLRAYNGMIVLDDGVIVRKSNCRDI